MTRLGTNDWRVKVYLPGIEVNRDQEGGSSRARHVHCTLDVLTSAISPNVGNSDALFIFWGLRTRYPLFTALFKSVISTYQDSRARKS